MHNLKEIRKDFDNFKKLLEKRFLEINLDNLEKLDKENREFIQKKRLLKKKKKIYQNQKINLYLKNQKKYQLK